MESSDTLPNRRPKNLFSRIFYCLLAVAFFILLLLALSTIGNTAVIYNKVKDDSLISSYNGKLGTCILYAEQHCTLEGEKYEFCLSSDPPCQFALSGGGIMAFTALILFGLCLLKAILGTKAFSFWIVVDLALVTATFLIGLASSGVISAGLATTCETYKEAYHYQGTPCCSYYIYEDDGKEKIYFYEPLNAAQISSWLATVILFIIMITDTIMIVAYACRRSTRNNFTSYANEYEDKDEIPRVAS